MKFKYDYDLTDLSENSSHGQIVSRIPPGSKVLEIGCATGYMSALLRERLGCHVTGVEIDAAAAERARPHLDRLIVADVEQADWLEVLGEVTFDRITLADVIEHLRDPEPILRALAGFLAPGGQILASVPNGAHVSIRLEMLEGRLTYEETGLLDRTHLHFYTHDSLRGLFARAGYRAEELTYTIRDVPDEILAERLERVGLSLTESAKKHLHAQDAVAFQYIVAAVPDPAASSSADARELTDLPIQQSIEYLGNALADRDRLREEKATLEHDRDNLQSHITMLGKQMALQEKELAEARAVRNSRTWRILRRMAQIRALFRRVRHFTAWGLRHPVRGSRVVGSHLLAIIQEGKPALRRLVTGRSDHLNPDRPADYHSWINQFERHDPDFGTALLKRLNDALDEGQKLPTISIVMPMFNPSVEHLEQAIASIREQVYPYWELCIVDDASTDAAGRELVSRLSGKDARIRLKVRETNGHICLASNDALTMANGQFIALMDQDDLVPPEALAFVAEAILKHPEAALVYSDEDKLSPEGERFSPYFKPDLNLDLLRSHNMICHLGVYRRSVVEKLGAFRPGFEGAQDYDLALRVIDTVDPSQVVHIPRVLYHWRVSEMSTASGAEAKPYALKASIRAVEEHLSRRGETGKVIESPLVPGMLRVSYEVPSPTPQVSIIIPTKNAIGLVRQCIESIEKQTTYPNWEIFLVDNNSDDPEALAYFKELENAGRAQVLRDEGEFNYSRINNEAARQATGDVLVLMNNDIEILKPDWLEEMVSHAMRPEIGAVGARLWYPDDRLQHGGVILGLGGIAGHAMKFLPRGKLGYQARAALIQNYSAVTAACLAVRRETYEAVDGLNETNLAVAFNDVDFCLRLRETGLRNLWTPYAEMYHHESASRGAEDSPEKQTRFAGECRYMKAKWSGCLDLDPAYNPNLTQAREDFSLNQENPWPVRQNDHA